MGYTEQYQQLREIFDLSAAQIPIPGTRMMLCNFSFHSEGFDGESWAPALENAPIKENQSFRYPVVVPSGAPKFNRAILYLHGLNERNWFKHLPGACFLAERTGNPVILFPLSHHINRGLPDWADARGMEDPLQVRKQKYIQVKDASVFNLALSERLTALPQRFFTSGYQSAMDLMKLKKELKTGQHPLFARGTKTDIFAYSISCMMLQALMISHSGNLLDESKIVFFAGGSLFSCMNGISRYIMDSVAFTSIQRYYLNLLSDHSGSWLQKSRYGRAFSWLIGNGDFDREREKSLQQYQSNLMVIALKNDRVIPVEGIRSAFGKKFCRSERFRIIHFPYSYTHENPFPVLNKNISPQVDSSFVSLYERVSKFLGYSLAGIKNSSGYRKTDSKPATLAS
jgi:hypothetical protein